MYVFLFCVFLYLPSYFLCRLQTNSRVRKNCKPFSGTAHFRDKLKLRIYEYIHVFSDYQGGVWILRYKCNDQAHVQTRKLLNKCRLCFSFFLREGNPGHHMPPLNSNSSLLVCYVQLATYLYIL